ncbi:hypothetical protein VTI74DRAFT_11403 [Chaetomium olivicolor]
MARLTLSGLLAVPWLLFLSLVSADAVLNLQIKGRPNLDALIAKSATCTKNKLKVRREWGDISAAEKKAYIAAMLCIMQKPSKLDPSKFPGAKSRYDDFVVVHMNQTLSIHGTGCTPAPAHSLSADTSSGQLPLMAPLLHLVL